MGVHFFYAAYHLANALRQPPNLHRAFLLQDVHALLQLRDQISLNRIERDRGQPEHRILDEHEDQDGEQGAPLESGQGDRIPDVSAERFRLAGDHRDDFTL